MTGEKRNYDVRVVQMTVLEGGGACAREATSGMPFLERTLRDKFSTVARLFSSIIVSFVEPWMCTGILLHHPYFPE